MIQLATAIIHIWIRMGAPNYRVPKPAVNWKLFLGKNEQKLRNEKKSFSSMFLGRKTKEWKESEPQNVN